MGFTSLKALCFSYLLSLWVCLRVSWLLLCTLKLNLFLRFFPYFLPLLLTPSPSASLSWEDTHFGENLLSDFMRMFVCIHSLCKCQCVGVFYMSHFIDFWSLELGFHILFWDPNMQSEFRGRKAPIDLTEIWNKAPRSMVWEQRCNRWDFTSDSFLGLNCLTVAAKRCSRASVSLPAIKKQMMPVSVAIEPEWHFRI